jgi:hypothetical protein
VLHPRSEPYLLLACTLGAESSPDPTLVSRSDGPEGGVTLRQVVRQCSAALEKGGEPLRQRAQPSAPMPSRNVRTLPAIEVFAQLMLEGTSVLPAGETPP